MWERFLLQTLKFLILKKVWFCLELFGIYCSPKMCKFRGTRTLEEPGPQRTQDPQRSVSIDWIIGEKICHIYTCITYNTVLPEQKIHIIHLRRVKKNFAFTFGQRTWHWACLVFTMLTIKKTTNKVHFLQYDICIKTLCTTLYLSLH